MTELITVTPTVATAMTIKCPRRKHQWSYKGKSVYYCTCPICRVQVSIRKFRVLLTDSTSGERTNQSVGMLQSTNREGELQAE